jgi:hypothetical protein
MFLNPLHYLLSHQQAIISSYLQQQLLVIISVVLAILLGLNWYLPMVFICISLWLMMLGFYLYAY